MKFLNKKVIIAVTVVVALIVTLIITAFSDNVIKLEYEIDINKTRTDINYSRLMVEQGIQCGSVKVVLGQEIDISPYTITNEVDKDGVKIMQLLAPSKKYELVVVGYGNAWHVQEIRTTVPGVASLYGFSVGNTLREVKDWVDIPNKKKVTIKEDDYTEVRLEFISDVLCVIDMRCV